MKIRRLRIKIIVAALGILASFYVINFVLYDSYHQQPVLPRTFVLGMLKNIQECRDFIATSNHFHLPTKLFYKTLLEHDIIQHSTQQTQFIHVESVFGSTAFQSTYQLIYNYLSGYAVQTDKIVIANPQHVFFYKNPFVNMHHNQLYISQDVATTRSNAEVAAGLKTCLHFNVDHFEYNRRAYNKNVIAGTWAVIKPLLKCIIQYNPRQTNYCEVAALNFCLHYKFTKQLPWHNHLINTKYLHCNGKYVITQNNCHQLSNTKQPHIHVVNGSVLFKT